MKLKPPLKINPNVIKAWNPNWNKNTNVNNNTNVNSNTNVNANFNGNSNASVADSASSAAAVTGATVVGATVVSAAPVYRQAVRGCLTKQYLPTGQALFQDVCTKEWAMNPPPDATQTAN